MKVSSLSLLLLVCSTGCGYLVSLLPDPDPDKLSGLSGEPPTLPPITQEGAGTMGCLVNGEVLVGRNTLASNPPPPESASINEFGNILLALRDDKANQLLQIAFDPLPPIVPDGYRERGDGGLYPGLARPLLRMGQPPAVRYRP